MSQVWIESDGHFLLGRLSTAEKTSDFGVLLAPGFLEPSSDLYYFNQVLLEELRQKKILGLAIDYLGHGDSFLTASDLNLDLLTQNIRDSISFMFSQGVKRIGLVGRGLAANLLNKIAVGHYSSALVFALNPLILNGEHLQKLQCYADSGDSMITLSKNTLIDLQEILYMAGVDMSNIEEENISRQFMVDLINNKLLFTSDNLKGSSKIIITNDMMRFYCSDVGEYICIEDFSSFNDRIRIILGIIRSMCELMQL